MISISDNERRNRLGHRHHLAGRSPDLLVVVDDLLILHATDPSSVYLSAVARIETPSIDKVAEELYERRRLIRMLGMRRTMYVVRREMVDVVQEACTNKIAKAERRKLVKLLQASSVCTDGESWLADLQSELGRAIQASDGMTARQLVAAVPELASEVVVGAGTKHEMTKKATSQVLALFGAEGFIQRGRPTGSWNGSQYRWVLRSDWLAGVDPGDASAGRSLTDNGTDAQVLLLTRLLAAYGPMSFDDITWWTGWTTTAARAALEGAEAVEVGMEREETGWLLPGDLDPVSPAAPWVALLPSLDPTSMGWKGRSWYLDDRYRSDLIDRTGNIGPTVWSDGRIVGGWACGTDGVVRTELLEEVASSVAAAIGQAAEELSRLLDGTIVTPKFRSSLERRLAS